jgi:hypothetical protein
MKNKEIVEKELSVKVVVKRPSNSDIEFIDLITTTQTTQRWAKHGKTSDNK